MIDDEQYRIRRGLKKIVERKKKKERIFENEATRYVKCDR